MIAHWFRRKKSAPVVVAASLLALTLFGCKREEITSYRVPKEKEPAPSRDEHDHSSHAQLVWKTPTGWEEHPAEGMRFARFTVKGKDGEEADISIIPLPSVSASKTDIVNLWREQIKLPAVKEEELDGLIHKVPVASAQADLFDMVSATPMIDDKAKARIIVAMLDQGSRMWFFKMTGPEELVATQKETFLEFLKGMEFVDKHHGDEPQLTSANSKQVRSADPKLPKWEPPPNWKEVTPGQMVLAKFAVEREGQKGEVTISSFPGDTGGLLANVNRWRGQVGLEAMSQADVQKETTPIDLSNGKGTLVDISGTNPRTGQPARLLGAIVPQGSSTWFYKFMGDPKLGEQEKTAFVKFVQSVRYDHAE